MQTYESIVGAHMCPVRQSDVVAACDNLNTKQTVGMTRVFEDPVAQAQTAVERFQYRT
jgi:hypothetical protein